MDKQWAIPPLPRAQARLGQEPKLMAVIILLALIGLLTLDRLGITCTAVDEIRMGVLPD